MARYILDINEERGITVLMIEHDMGVVMDLSAPGDGAGLRREDRRRRARRGAATAPRSRPPTWAGRRLDVRAMTFPRLLVGATRATLGGRARCGRRTCGIWRETSWARYCDRVRDVSLGLIALGLGRGDKVAIVGDNRPEWIFAELAAQSAGAASVGIYQDSNLAEVGYVIDHCDAQAAWWPRTRSRWTRSSACSTSSPRWRTSSTRTRAGCAGTSTRSCSPSTRWSSAAARSTRSQPGLYDAGGRTWAGPPTWR